MGLPRRDLIRMLPVAATTARIPTDADGLNRMADAWNNYAKALSSGEVSVVLWGRVVKEWDRLTGGCK